MNVLFLTRFFYPHFGGVEKHVLKLSQTLLKQGLSVAVLTTQHDNSLKLRDEHQGIVIHRIPRHLTTSKYKLWPYLLKKQELFKHSDIIHAHDVFWWYLPFLFRANHQPIFTSFHGWEGHFPPTVKAKFWRKLAQKGSKANICVGDFVPKWYGTKTDAVVYGATDQQPLVDGDPDRVVVLGRLSQDNDINLVLESLALLKQTHPKLKVQFLGDGEASFDAEKIGRVLGFQDQIEDHLVQAKWVVASSYLSMMEAMAAGRYVFSFHSNPLKSDYLRLHPQAKNFSINSKAESFVVDFLDHYNHADLTNKKIKSAQTWALGETWEKLSGVYMKLWRDHDMAFAVAHLPPGL